MAAFHYLLRVKLIRSVNESGEFNFIEEEKKFEDENPIVARRNAINSYQSYIDILLQSKEKKYFSDKQARIDLKSFIEPGTRSKIKVRNQEIEFSDSMGNGIGIILIIDLPKPDEIWHDEIGDEIFIHGIDGFDMKDDPCRLISSLEKEYEYYKYYGYETQDEEIEVVFYDEEEWNEGYLGNGEWLKGYSEPNTYQILNTPFDWTGLDELFWWEDEEKKKVIKVTENSPNNNKIIQNGETNQVEFKPSLLYNFSTGRAGIGIKGIIAKTICAFLNSKGGFLFIGVNDKGEAQGLSWDFSLSMDKNEKDFFLLEFDSMINHFLTFSVKDNVSGEFIELDGKIIFKVTVFPNKRRPSFLNGQNGKEFYIRGEASSNKITDIEELVNYCLDKWGY